MILLLLCLFLFVVVIALGLFVVVCFQVCDVVIVLVFSSADQKINSSYFGIVYKFEVRQGSLAVTRELFIISYILNIFY